MAPLTDDEASALGRIVSAPQAFLPAAELGDTAGLEARHLVELWHRPDFTAATLTPLGAALMAVEIAERWANVPAEDRADPRVNEAYEEPFWVPGTNEPRPPLRSLRYAHEVPLPCPERVVDHRAAAADVLRDDDGEPVTLWGRAVPVDPRLGKRAAPARKAKAAKRRAG